jgi:hypothetical protein
VIDHRHVFFDPLSTFDLTDIICATFEDQPLLSLVDEMNRFDGAGLYAIYYTGRTRMAGRGVSMRVRTPHSAVCFLDA